MVVFIDPRATYKLNSEARQFVFSVMNQHIRLRDPDYADVQLGIIQFSGKVADGHRPGRLFISNDESLFAIERIQQMVDRTYAIRQEVLRGKDADTQRRSNNSGRG